MIEPVSFAIGAASLAIQLLDGCKRGYEFLLAVSGMPRDCQYLRTRLRYEHLRFEDWCEAAGFGEGREHSRDLPESVRSTGLVVVAILTDMQLVMDGLAEMAKKHKHLKGDSYAGAMAETDEVQTTQKLQHLTARHKQGAKQDLAAEQPDAKSNGKRRWMSMTANLKSIAKDPGRFTWVAFHREEFVRLLGRFKEFNENLYQLLHGEQSRHLMDLTRKTQLDMVLVRKSVEELKHLHMAAMLLGEQSQRSPAKDAELRRSDEVFASLAEFKELNAATEASQDSRPATYDKVTKSTVLARSRITLAKEDTINDTSMATRVAAVVDLENAEQRSVWVEWRAYTPEFDTRKETMVPLQDNIRRIQELVALLKCNKLQEFCAPICHGYFDDRDDEEEEERLCRFGLVFELPNNPQSLNIPRTLYSMLRTSPPSLSDRIRLAQKLATCLLYLHAVNWLHKGIKSDNVIFSNQANLSKPYLSGFGYARPDTTQDKTQFGRWETVNKRDELYRHPLYQGPGPKGNYRKTYDIYSLGIVLLEVVLWKPIESIMGLEGQLSNAANLRSIKRDLEQPDSKYMRDLRAQGGDKYEEAVASCVAGRSAFGIADDEDETDIVTATKLQRGFMTHVVDALRSIRL